MFNQKEYNRAYYAKHAEKKRAYAKAYRKAHPEYKLAIKKWQLRNAEKILGYVAKWRKENPEKAAAKAREYANKFSANNRQKKRLWEMRWRQANKHSDAVKTARRRATKKRATPLWADNDLIKDIYLEAQYQHMQVDHIIPLNSKYVCGLHWEGNLQLLTQADNLKKHTRFIA